MWTERQILTCEDPWLCHVVPLCEDIVFKPSMALSFQQGEADLQRWNNVYTFPALRESLHEVWEL